MFKYFKVSGILLGIMTLVLAGCSSSEESSSSNKNTTAAETEENETDSAEETPAEPVISEDALIAENFKELIKSLTDNSVEVSQESYDYIVKNHTLFPANSKDEIAEAKKKTDSSISYKHLNKNAQPYYKKITTFQGTVVSVEENPLDDGTTISLVHVMDDDFNSYQVILYKSTGDILEEDTVRFWGVPVGASSFENVSGGTTNVQNFLGSHIEKIN